MSKYAMALPSAIEITQAHRRTLLDCGYSPELVEYIIGDGPALARFLQDRKLFERRRAKISEAS